MNPPDMPLNGPRRSSQLKIDVEGLPEGKSHVNVMCFDLGGLVRYRYLPVTDTEAVLWIRIRPDLK